MSYLDELNPKQRNAADHKSGPLLILAGAGAGKTKTVTYRIVNLINNGVAPENILAVTFTNKAANEMRSRVDSILKREMVCKTSSGAPKKPTIRTFHSLGVLIIRENFEKFELPKNFSILDRVDSKKIIRDILKELGIDLKINDPGKILAVISKQKGEFKDLSAFSEEEPSDNGITDLILKVWIRYEQKMKGMGGLDFDDLLLKPTKLLKKDGELRERYQNRWQFVHIDEYQDTNKVQYEMTGLLVQKHKNICVVGDVDQNIYSWRGATIKNIMNFEKDYPGAKQITLEENYRSTQNILKVANDVISKNIMRHKKNLFTKKEAGEKISVYQAIDEYGEARFAVLKAKELMNNGVEAEQIAFLYRTNFQSRVLEEICLQNNLPYQVVGTRFFDRKEIKDIIAYIKAATNKKDLQSLDRIINTPTRGIGKATILKINAREENSLTKLAKERVSNFRKLLKKIQIACKKKKPHEVVSFIFKQSGLEDKFAGEGEDGLERSQNVKELVSLAKKYAYLNQNAAMEAFLDDVSLTSDQDTLDLSKNTSSKQKDKRMGIKLMTIHASKGLEFDYVFITGLEDGLFPARRDNKKKEDEEEERRLFYVAITRARKKLFLLWASLRTIYGTKQTNLPSIFLEDIDSDLTDKENYSGPELPRGSDGRNTFEYLIDF